MKVPVSSIAPGKAVLYRGEPCIVLERRKEGTLLMSVEHIEHIFGSSNNFAASSLRAHLNGAYGHPGDGPAGHREPVAGGQ